jgi:hypothetical protein
MSTINGPVTCTDDDVIGERICWLEDPWTGGLRVTILVLEGLCFIPDMISSKDRAL